MTHSRLILIAVSSSFFFSPRCSLPAKFITSTRHIKEILESLFDEKGLVEEQWEQRNTVLRQALNLKKFQEESKKVSRAVSSYCSATT